MPAVSVTNRVTAAAPPLAPAVSVRSPDSAEPATAYRTVTPTRLPLPTSKRSPQTWVSVTSERSGSLVPGRVLSWQAAKRRSPARAAVVARAGVTRGRISLPCAPSSVRFLHWPFVQWQDSGLWIRQWWFESTRANWIYELLAHFPGLRDGAPPQGVACLRLSSTIAHFT